MWTRPSALILQLLLLIFAGEDRQAYASAKGTPLNDFIGDFEGLSYNKDELMTSHHRMRRSVHGQRHLDFRLFHFELYPGTSMFSRDFKLLVNGRATRDADLSMYYSGQDIGDLSVVAQGDLSHGMFVGTISTSDQQYHIEPAHHHFKDQPDFHSIIYRSSDVKFDAIRGSSCGLSNQTIFKKMADDQTSDHLFFGTFDPVAGASIKKRQLPNRLLTRCKLFLRGDARFYEAVTSSTFTEAQRIVQAQNYLTRAVATVNSIYESTVFYGTQPSSIGFEIAEIDILTQDTGVFENAFLGPQAFLEAHSKENFEDYCASYRFTQRDFDGGILGLAYVGNVNSVGGICSSRMNTGIVTMLNYGRRVPSLVSWLTFAHELGHNFGALHDPSSCVPGLASGGNYIMFESASTGVETNNNKFSSCSIAMMNNIITNVAQSAGTRQCFIEDPGDCGNGMLDAGEQCDCRFDYDQDTGICNSDPCCRGSNCTLVSGATCSQSPSLNVCCTSSCQPTPDTSLVCSPSSECAQEARCDGSSSTCPPPQYNTGPNGTALACANHTGTCLNGECSGSLCLLLDMRECSCTSAEDACSLCCRDNTATSPCNPVSGESFSQGVNVSTKLRPGSFCSADNSALGYCDFYDVCRRVDRNAALQKLYNFFTSLDFLNFVQWLVDMWWILAVSIVVIFSIMFAVVLVCHLTIPRHKEVHSISGSTPRSDDDRVRVQRSRRRVHPRQPSQRRSHPSQQHASDNQEMTNMYGYGKREI